MERRHPHNVSKKQPLKCCIVGNVQEDFIRSHEISSQARYFRLAPVSALFLLVDRLRCDPEREGFPFPSTDFTISFIAA